MEMQPINLRALEFAHDLKVPVQLIASCVQLLEEELCANAKTAGYLRTLARSADQIQTMLENALEAEEVKLGLRDIIADCRSLCREFALLARKKGVRVHFTENVSKFNMRCDGEKLRRMLDNLLSNALRFTPSGGKISVRLQVLGDAVEIFVEDSGCGIAQKDLDRIFEDGFSTGGSGHGLAIVRKYAEYLGGSVSVRSRQGLGSCFTLHLPVEG